MRTNLIQSYVNGNSVVHQYNSDKAVKDFDVNKELANRTFIKPLPSNGKLIRPSLFDMPSEIANGWKYDWNAFVHAAKGEANDHELGRLNDVGMKLGGLTIASYLFTKKSTPMTKVFEFIGLASFFGAMDLWPKLFLQAPAYLIHGVNVRQQYEDSFGRKKMFYQDHQFIPWDLYSDKEIHKIGDRMRVPKDIPNRREFIQEKMRKIALQNNTMWMLTAGFATPIMSALICNGLEKSVSRYQDRKINKEADDMLTNFNQEVAKFDFSKNQAKLEQFLEQNKDKTLTEDMFKEIHSNLTEGLDPVTANALKKDLREILPVGDKYNLSKDTVENVRNVIKTNFAKASLSEDELAKIIPDNERIINAFSQQNLLNAETKGFSEHSKIIQNLMDEGISKFITENPNHPKARDLKFIMSQLIHSKEHGKESALLSSFKFQPSSVLSGDMIEMLKGVSSTMNSFRSKVLVLDHFAYKKTAQAPETILANSWNEITESLMKTMKFTPEEITHARLDREIAGSIFRNKLEGIAANKESYNAFVSDIDQLLSGLHDKMASLDKLEDELGHVSDNSPNSYASCVNSTYTEAAEALKQNKMFNAAETLVGYGDSTETSLRDIQLSFVSDRIKGVKSSFYRILDMADMYYKISHISDIDASKYLPATMLREVKEELVELAKVTLLEGHTSDFAVKLFQNRNPKPEPSDFSQIESKDGKVVNKYFGTRRAVDLAERSNDKNAFDTVMKLMFEWDLHSDTNNKISNSVFYQDFKNYRKNALELLGGDYYFVKPFHLVDGKRVDSSSELKFLLTGCAPDEMFLKLFNQSFNSRKWFSTFGKLGAGLVGVTVLSQFFMGKMKTPSRKKEVK